MPVILSRVCGICRCSAGTRWAPPTGWCRVTAARAAGLLSRFWNSPALLVDEGQHVRDHDLVGLLRDNGAERFQVRRGRQHLFGRHRAATNVRYRSNTGCPSSGGSKGP